MIDEAMRKAFELGLDELQDELRDDAAQIESLSTHGRRMVAAHCMQAAAILRSQSAALADRDAQIAECGIEIERLRRQYEEEYAIVDRVWGVFGHPSMARLNGRTIVDLVADTKTRAETAESSLADARAEIERLRAEARIQTEAKQLAEAMRDKERMDWLQRTKRAIFETENLNLEISAVRLFTVGSQHVRGNTVREAIDAAIAQRAEPTDHILPASPEIGDCVVVDAKVGDTIEPNPKQNWPRPKR